MAGTSAGAITALLLGLGYDKDTSKEELERVFFESYNIGDSLLRWPLVLRSIRREYGAESAEFFLKWAENIVAAKLGNKDATFMDACKAILNQKGDNYNFKYMYFTGANLSTGYYEIFSHEHTPDMKIADAVRISMSIPLVFTAKRYTKPGRKESDLYVDGGVLNNYPLHIFDERNQPNMKTLGFRVDYLDELTILRDGVEPVRNEIGGFISYSKALFETMMNVSNNITRRSDDKIRTVFIDITGVNTLSFNLSEERKQQLIESGSKATRMYLISRPDKLKTNNSRLEKFDRKRIYEKASEVYYCSIGEESAKVQYWFKDSDLKPIHKYVDRLKDQERVSLVEIFTGAVDDRIKVVEVITSKLSLEEIEKWDSSIKKASGELKQISVLPLVKVESWKKQEYVELKAIKKHISLELIEAAHVGNSDRVIDLLSARVTPDSVDKHGCTALHYASEFGYCKIVELLLRNIPAPNINLRDNSGETALHRAAFQGHTNVVSLLLQHNANVDVKSAYGATPLHRAAYNGHKEVMAELIKLGSAINAIDEIMQNTPLHWVVAHNHKEAAELLLKQGADTTIRNKEGKLALDCAQSFEMKEIFRRFTVNMGAAIEK